MSRKTAFPSIPEQGDEAVHALKEAMEVGLRRRGNPLEGFVTFRDLEDVGMGAFAFDGDSVRLRGRGTGAGFAPGTGDGGDRLPTGADDLTKPPRPRNVRARGLSLSSIGVSWASPNYHNHNYAEVFASLSNNWSEIRRSFNADQPTGPGNATPYLMGRATGTLFLHNNLQTTIPFRDFRYGTSSLSQHTSTTVRIILEQPADEFKMNEVVYLTGPTDWPGNGVQGRVTLISGLEVQIEAVLPSGALPAPTTVEVVRMPQTDELDEALSPATVYYWVRFVSMAGVVGDVQSEEGVSGSVFIDPERVLDVLTGRIRKSQLAQDIISPINFITGPLTELNPDGSRKFPTIRDFVLAQGDEILTEYDEILRQVILGEVTGTEFDGIAAVAAVIDEIDGRVDENGAYIQTLQTLQAGFEEGTVTGLESIISTIQSRKLVEATDEGAMTLIADTMQIELDTAYAQGTFLNDARQQIQANEEGISNSFTVKLQQNIGGVLSATGFGIGLETSPGGEVESTFAIAADQFAIMSAASQGRVCSTIRQLSSPTRYRVEVKGSWSTTDELTIDSRVTITVPFTAHSTLRNALRGRVFRVLNRSGSTVSPVWIDIVDAEGGSLPSIGFSGWSLDGQYAMFPEQAIPFVVNTTVSPPVIGIRGRLVVDGLISATEAEIQSLAATQVWSQNITNWGLINTRSLVGEVIATPRRAGWAVRMKIPSFSGQSDRVLEFGRWTTQTDSLPNPDPNDPDSLDPAQWDYPQLELPSEDTAFWLNSFDGSAYIRGHLTVGGNARIWTGAGGDDSRHMVQMDHEFPLMIVDKQGFRNQALLAGDGQNISYNNTGRNWVRANALLWAHRSGSIGFNTATDSIFAGDTPLEPPSGGGGVKVITRLDNGAITGVGRVYVNANVISRANRWRPYSMLNVTYLLFLADAATDYGGMAQTIQPSSRNSVQMPSPGGPMQSMTPAMADFMDSHAIIIRAPDSSTGSYNDPGWNYFKQWEDQMAADGKPLWFITSFGTTAYPGQHVLHGSVSVPASANYKALIVAVERFNTAGDPIFGSITTSSGNNSGACIGIPQGQVFSQQISTRQPTMTVAKNTGPGSTGGGTGSTGGGSTGGGSAGGGFSDPGDGETFLP